MKKLRILAAGDFHGDDLKARKLSDKAKKEKVDLVVLCGDISFSDMETENLIGPFVKNKQKVLLVPGNHESIATTNFLADIYGIKNLHGYSVRYKDVGLFGCSGTNLGINQIDEDEVFNLLKKGHDRIKYLKKRIMVTHVHPKDSKIEFSGFEGSSGVRKAIDRLKPDILLCSHIHEAEGIEEKIGKTKVINVGSEGRIIEI